MITPQEVISVLNKAKISFVLVGAYGLAGWRKESCGTEVVDVVVAAKQVKKAVQLLLEAFPQLEPIDLPMVVRLWERETQDVFIDVMKPVQQPYCEVFRHTHAVSADRQSYRVPSLEMAVVMEFAAMTSLYRAAEDKLRDAQDFIRIVKNNRELDKDKVAQLASLIYPDGGKDILELVQKAMAGETFAV
jgi:hypothetical protein